MGMLPASQYGSVAVLPQSFLGSLPSNSVIAVTTSGTDATGVANPASTNSVSTYNLSPSLGRRLEINSNLSALSIRATEYLQRWKEV